MACGGCGDDVAGGGGGRLWHSGGSGRRPGCILQLFAARKKKTQCPAGSDLCDRGLLGVAVCGLWGLRWGHSAGLADGDGAGHCGMGSYGRQMAAARFFRLLAGGRKAVILFVETFGKNIRIFQENCKKSICKMEEMGYNRREYLPRSAGFRRWTERWQKKDGAIVWC